jgi:hypothetical protein
MIDYAVLKAECQNNPQGYSLDGLTLTQHFAAGNDGPCATILNTVRAGITVRRANIAASEVLEAVAQSDFVSNPNLLLGSYFESVTQQPTIRLENDDGSDTRILTNLKQCFSPSTASRTRLNAIANRTGSRAEQLFGRDTVLSADDIVLARNTA